MPRQTPLEKQWDELMFLYGREKQLRDENTHRVLLNVLTRRIDELAREMGFNENQIETRDFRAERVDGRIVSIEKTLASQIPSHQLAGTRRQELFPPRGIRLRKLTIPTLAQFSHL